MKASKRLEELNVSEQLIVVEFDRLVVEDSHQLELASLCLQHLHVHIARSTVNIDEVEDSLVTRVQEELHRNELIEEVLCEPLWDQ